MPIYAYKCSSCGHAADALQKMSADPLTECPACGKSTYSKQVTAPSFQLKGSGWYVTDFKGEKKPAAVPVAAEAGKDAAPTTDTAKSDKPAETATSSSSESSTAASPAATPPTAGSPRNAPPAAASGASVPPTSASKAA